MLPTHITLASKSIWVSCGVVWVTNDSMQRSQIKQLQRAHIAFVILVEHLVEILNWLCKTKIDTQRTKYLFQQNSSI